jgi:hypothetical protein
MAETNKLPRVITSDGHHAVEIADGVFIRWWNKKRVACGPSRSNPPKAWTS